MPRSIAKVNARSIDGYFGEGTSCFFIRGTVLSDTTVGGEYLTLSFARPGNIIEISAFDGTWAVVGIETRSGNRQGDNVRARLYLRDDDLKLMGVDCAKIAERNSLPFSFAVETLFAQNLFENGEPELYVPIEDDPPPPVVIPQSNGLANGHWAETVAPDPEPEAALPEPDPEPLWEHVPPLVREPEPLPVLEAVLPEPPPPQAVVLDPEPAPTAEERFDLSKFVELLRSGNSPLAGNPLLQVGASVAAVAAPVLLYMMLAFLRGKPDGAGGDEGGEKT